jgi:glyoxylase-like metal-dependent hydrolase (beta-lactamase superfamily II)
LYRARNDRHFTVFLVTADGIALSDPINREFSEWLRAELDERFGQPVRYVLYSHHHWDHASGGEVFADTAEFVGHEAMAQALAMPAADTRLPAGAADLDENGNGSIERREARANFATQFANYDADGDGALSGAEIARGPLADVYPASRSFEDRTTVTLGGEPIEMIHLGPTHSPDMTVLRFPEEDAVFFVDIISVRRLPFQALPGYDIDELLSTIRRVEALDFSIAIGGHGDVGDKSDVADFRAYVEDLRDAVAAGIAAGQSLEELESSIEMEAYSDWGSYDEWLTLNIQGMHRILTSGD